MAGMRPRVDSVLGLGIVTVLRGHAVEPRDRVPGQLILLLHERSLAQVSCAAVLWGPRKCGDRNVYTSRQSRQKLGLQNARRSAGKTLGSENLPPKFH